MPVVLGVTGHALAMGGILTTCADYRVGADGPFKIGLNEVAIGMPVPGFAIGMCRDRLIKPWFQRCLQTAYICSPAEAVAGRVPRRGRRARRRRRPQPRGGDPARGVRAPRPVPPHPRGHARRGRRGARARASTATSRVLRGHRRSGLTGFSSRARRAVLGGARLAVARVDGLAVGTEERVLLPDRARRATRVLVGVVARGRRLDAVLVEGAALRDPLGVGRPA